MSKEERVLALVAKQGSVSRKEVQEHLGIAQAKIFAKLCAATNVILQGLQLQGNPAFVGAKGRASSPEYL